MYGNSLDAMQCSVLTKTYLEERPYRRPCRCWSRAPCAGTHRLSIQDGLTHRCVCVVAWKALTSRQWLT